MGLHDIIDRQTDGVAQGSASVVGVESVPLGRGGVEADGDKVGALQHLYLPPFAQVVVEDLRCDEELGEVADNKAGVADMLLGGKYVLVQKGKKNYVLLIGA